MYLSHKIRLYPTKDQELKFKQHFDAVKFIWNWALGYQLSYYKSGGSYLNYPKMSQLLTKLKREPGLDWLHKVSNGTLQGVLRDLDTTYTGFFKGRNRFPRFKRKKDVVKSFPVKPDNKAFYFNDTTVRIPSVGTVKYKTSKPVAQGAGVHSYQKISVVRMHNKWILIIGYKCENQAPLLNSEPMGIDLGVKVLASVAIGNSSKFKIPSINKSRTIKNLEAKLKHVQRNISRKFSKNKTTTSNRYKKLVALAAKINYRLANIRHNYVHQTTSYLVAMLPAGVVMENLNLTGLQKNKHLSHAIKVQNLGMFIRCMQYKCEKVSIPFFQVDRFFPSSKKCALCGAIKTDLKLSDRRYHCSNCGYTEDRDFNAAINLMNEFSHFQG